MYSYIYTHAQKGIIFGQILKTFNKLNTLKNKNTIIIIIECLLETTVNTIRQEKQRKDIMII